VGLAEDFKAATATPPKGIDLWINGLNDEDRAVLLQAAPDPAITHTAFTAIVKANGARVGKDAVTAWRRANGFTR